MHFSWMGPLFTPDYEMPAPQPPVVAAAAFEAAMPIEVGLVSDGPALRSSPTSTAMAPSTCAARDAFRYRPGHLRAAVARYGFEACSQISVTAPAR